MAERTYTEREIRALLERAAKRQEAARRASDAARGGLTLAELQAVAAEAGIAPEHIAAAATEMARPEAARQTFLSAPTTVQRTRLLPTRPSEDTWARLVQDARQTFGKSGIAGQIGPVREWTVIGGTPNSDVFTRLALEPDGEGARLTLAQDARQFARGFAIASAVSGLMALVFAVIWAFSSESDLWVAVTMMTAMSLLFGIGMQGGMRAWERVQSRRFDGILDRLELLARDGAVADEARAGAPEPALRPAPRPELDLEDAERDDLDAPAAEAPRRRTRRSR